MSQIDQHTVAHQLQFIAEHQAAIIDHYAALLECETQRANTAQDWVDYYASIDDVPEDYHDDLGADDQELIDITHQATQEHQAQSLRAAQEFETLYPTDDNGSIPVFDHQE